MDLIVYSEDCVNNKPNFDRPNLEMLKTNVFNKAVEADRVVLVSSLKGKPSVTILKNRLNDLGPLLDIIVGNKKEH